MKTGRGFMEIKLESRARGFAADTYRPMLVLQYWR